jgi:DNA topoisomerase IA
VVARYEAIQAFRPETFFALRMSFQCARRVEAGDAENAGNGGPSELFHFSWTRHRVYDWACAMAVGWRLGVGGADLTPPNSPPAQCYQLCMDHPEATVCQVTRKPKSKWKPVPLSTVELQVRASKWCRCVGAGVARRP